MLLDSQQLFALAQAKQKIQAKKEVKVRRIRELPRVRTRGCIGLSKYMICTDVIDI